MSDENVLRISLGSLEDFEEETVADLEEIERGGTGANKIMFADPEMFREILTEKRQELLEEVMAHPPESIRALAAALDRGVREVHDDLHLLENYGIVTLEEEGGRKKPRVPYDRIHIEIDLPARPDTDAATARAP